MHHRVTRVVLMAAPVLALLGMIGCQGTTPMTEPPAPVPPAPVPTLQGTWLHEGSYDDDDGRIFTERQLVTLTGGGRAITDNAVFDDTGALEDAWQWGEGYTVTDTTVTRTIPGDVDDGEEPTRDVVKMYFWGEDRNTVFMNPWGHEETTDELIRYTRVADPLPSLVGTWTFTHDGGELEGRDVIVTIGADGSFMLDNEEADGGVWRLTGSIGEVDPDTLIAPLTGLERSNLDETGAVVRDPGQWGVDGTGQIGLAPGIDGALVASPPWDERNTEGHPYGNYWLRLTAVSDA